MTYDDLIAKKQETRSLALTQKVGLEKAEQDAIDQREFNYTILFGDGSNLGINNIFSLYYQELYLGVGRETATPNLRLDSKESWTERFNVAITIDGDGPISDPPEDAIYPEENGVGSKDINTDSSWFNDNQDDEELEEGLAGDCLFLRDEVIGTEATETGDARASFPTQEQAIEYAEATGGAGLLGKRTQNSTIVQGETWVVGDGGIDDPDYYSNPEKSDLLNGLQALISNLASGGAYRQKITQIQTEVGKIQSGDNAIFVDAGIWDDPSLASQLFPDIGLINTLHSNLQALIGTSSDALPTQTLWAFFNHFDNASGGGGSFNNNLNDLKTLLSSIISTFQTRANSIPAKLGTVSEGLRRWRFFWSQQNIEKPVSPVLIVRSIQTAKQEALINIQNANNTLNVIFSGQYSKWIQTPQLFSAFFNPRIDKETFEIIQNRNGIIWSGPQHATAYEIYRLPLSSVTEFVENWTTGLIDTFTTVNPETGFIPSQYTDLSVTFGETYVYRIRVIDSVNDPFSPTTTSDQSMIYNPATSTPVPSAVNGELIVPDDHEFEVGNFIFIPGYGISRVTFAGNTTIKIEDTTYSTASPIIIYKAPSVVKSEN